MMDVEKMVKTALEKGADEVAVRRIHTRDVQIRLSMGKVDIVNRWDSISTGVFLAVDGRTTGLEIKRGEDVERALEKAVRFCRSLPKNPDFRGLYSGKGGSGIRDMFVVDDLFDLAREVKDSVKGRFSGELYLADETVEVATNYNHAKENRSALITTVRVFNEEGGSGQESTHVADRESLKMWGPAYVGRRASEVARMNVKRREGEEGRYTVLFGPLCFGSFLTEISGALSAFSVDAGISFFTNRLRERVSSEVFSLEDDPSSPGVGRRGFDDEAAPARRTVLIEKGVLKTYLHTHSTAKKFSTETTGNASGGEKMSALLPEGWQTKLSPGKRAWEDILGDVKNGLYIANTWYTRYQDFRGGDFSTIPRDGIFYIEDGEIKEAWSGVRISENMLHVLKNVVELSREVVPVHWWGEVSGVFSPYALVENVKVTRAR